MLDTTHPRIFRIRLNGKEAFVRTASRSDDLSKLALVVNRRATNHYHTAKLIAQHGDNVTLLRSDNRERTYLLHNVKILLNADQIK